MQRSVVPSIVGLDAHPGDAAGDVGEILFGLAAHVQCGQVAVGSLGNAQLDVAIGRAEHAVAGSAQPSPFPEGGELAGVGDAELDVEESVERHHAPTLA